MTTTVGPGAHVQVPRRLGWSFAVGWLVLVAGVEFGVSWVLPTIGESLTGPALAVAGSGFVVGWIGYLGAAFLRDKGKITLSPSVRRALGIGTVALPMMGSWSSFPFTWTVFLPVTATVASISFVGVVIGVLRRRRNLSVGFLPVAVWTFGAFGTMALTCYLYLLAVPLASFPQWGQFDSAPILTLKFVVLDELPLNRLVPLAERKVKEAPQGCLSGRAFPVVPVLGKLSQVCARDGHVVLTAIGSPWRALVYKPDGPGGFLVLKVTVPGHSRPVYVSIGLAGDGMVARTILYSMWAVRTTRSTSPSTGVVTGVAEACEGIAPAGRTFHVKVSLYSASKPVASETVVSGSRYRFSVTPGTYQVKGWWGSRSETVRAGVVVTDNFMDICK